MTRHQIVSAAFILGPFATACGQSAETATTAKQLPAAEVATSVPPAAVKTPAPKAAAPLAACPTSAPGPAMVEFGTQRGDRYCMDRTEVTQRQYAEFLAAKVDPAGQTHSLCSIEKNSDFGPRVLPPPCNAFGGSYPSSCVEGTVDPETRGDEPMVCIDFCDATAYCAWAGKRLCGIQGKPGRTLGNGFDAASEFNSSSLSRTSHWNSACNAKGARARAYAANFDVARCSGRKAVGSRPECVTQGTSGIVYDLMGGVAEWQDSCTDDGYCRILGGMFGVGSERGSCAQDATTSSGAADENIGFRCCADLVR